MFSSASLRFFVATFTLSISWVWPITPPVGGLRADNLADLAPHPQTSKGHNEFWTYQLWLNNGMQAQVNLSRARFGNFKDPVCGADFSLMSFQGRDYFVAREYKIGNFVFDTATVRLAVHEKIFFEGLPPLRHRLFFSTAKKGTSYFLDLSFDDMSPGAVWGDGVFRLKENQRVGLFFHIPRARVTGRIAIDGDTQTVEGFGWMDHTFQTDFATKLIDAGYRYVALPKPFHPSGNTEGGYFFTQGSTRFGYGLREGKDGLTLLRPFEIKSSKLRTWGGVGVPQVVEFTFEGAAPMRFESKQGGQATSALQELSRMERFGARMFLGGEIFGFRGTATVHDSLPALYSFTVIKR